MQKKFKVVLSLGLVAVVTASSIGFLGEGKCAFADTDSKVTVTDDEMKALCTKETFTRGSVHDPSVIDDGNGTYYVFGSHMGVAKTTDLMNWTSVTSESETSPLFGTYDDAGNLNTVSYNQAFRKSAYTGDVTTVINGVTSQQKFGTYDASAWNTALDNYTVSGNMWAPDVVYNKTMNKWCMYLSLNGKKWNSVVILLTADDINGPYVYQGPIVYTGFSNTNDALSYKNTDLQLVYVQLDSLPSQYNKADDGSWGEYWPHAIDPCVFYDENGNLVMTYGSWSGGIYELQLADSSRNTANNIQVINENVTQAVKELVASSEKIIGFIHESVLPDYESFVESGKQYSEDAIRIDESMLEFASESKEIMDKMTEIKGAIEGISHAVEESARGVSDSAINVDSLVRSISTVKDQMEENSNVAKTLKEESSNFVNL